MDGRVPTPPSKWRQILACISEAYAEHCQYCQVISGSHPPSQSHDGQGGQVLLQELPHIYQRCVPKHEVSQSSEAVVAQNNAADTDRCQLYAEICGGTRRVTEASVL